MKNSTHRTGIGQAAPMVRALQTSIAVLLLAGPAHAADDGGGASSLFYFALNLALLIGVLVYFGRKPFMAFFNDRRGRIQDDLHAAAELKREAEERYAKWQRKLVDLQEEIASIRAASRERAESERDHIVADAKASAERIRADATAAIEQELRRSRAILREEAADLAVELAAKLLREQVSDADRDRLVTEFIGRIEAAGSGSPSDRPSDRPVGR